MSKEMKTGVIELPPHHGWHDGQDAPYIHLMKCLTANKSQEEIDVITKEVEDSYTYALICERGAWSPRQILKLYQAEKEYGICGFVRVLMTDIDFKNSFYNHLYELNIKIEDLNFM